MKNMKALKHIYLHIGTMPVDNVCLVLFCYINKHVSDTLY